MGLYPDFWRLFYYNSYDIVEFIYYNITFYDDNEIE